MRIWNSIEMERETGVTIDRVLYAVRKGRLEEFAKVRGAYVFFEADLRRIEDFFRGKLPWQRTNCKKNTTEGVDQ